MKTEQEQIKEMTKDLCGGFGGYGNYDTCGICSGEDDNYYGCEDLAKYLICKGYRKASDVIGEFVERINLIECEMFHKAHDSRNYYEYKINNGNTEDRVWGGKRECDGKMVALQDFMTKIEKLADEMRQEVEK